MVRQSEAVARHPMPTEGHRPVAWCGIRGLAIGIVVAATLAFLLLGQGPVLVAGLAGGAGAITRRWPLVVVGVGLSIAAMVNRGFLNHATHRSVGLPVRLGPMIRTAMVSFAANKVVKAGGVGGLVVFIRDGRRRGHDARLVGSACALAALLSFAALGASMAVTVVLLAIGGQLTGWWVLASLAFVAYATALMAGLRVVLRNRELGERMVLVGRRLVARVRRRPRPGRDDTVDIVQQAAMLVRGSRWSRRAAVHALASNGLGALMLLVAAAAAGAAISAPTAIVFYTTALAASAVAPVPGGLGVVEASTGALMVADGTPIAIAGAAVVLFRLFDFWVPLVSGLVATRVGLGRSGRGPGDGGVLNPLRPMASGVVQLGPGRVRT